MGSTLSKAIRKLPKRAELPSWAGSTTANSAATKSLRPKLPQLSGTKNEAIEEGSRDPQLLSNLSRIGPVRVDQHMQSFHLDSQVNHMHQSRARSEVEATASHPTRNRLLSGTLSDLLDERKKATSLKELETIANIHDIDIMKLESLARFVNSPAIGEGTIVRTRDAGGDQIITSTAVWAEPTYSQKASSIR